jgi:hypothetical protein
MGKCGRAGSSSGIFADFRWTLVAQKARKKENHGSIERWVDKSKRAA